MEQKNATQLAPAMQKAASGAGDVTGDAGVVEGDAAKVAAALGAPPSLAEGSAAAGAPAASLAATEAVENLHTLFLKSVLDSVQFLPIESNKLEAATDLESHVESLASVADMTDVDRINSLVKDSELLVLQLGKSINIAVGDLKRAVAGDEREVKKRKTAEEKQSAALLKKELDATEVEERRRLNSVKLSGSFKLKFAEKGHPAVEMFDNNGAALKCHGITCHATMVCS